MQLFLASAPGAKHFREFGLGTVTVGATTLVKNGKLMDQASRR